MKRAIFLAVIALAGCKDMGSGDKIGNITRLSKEGFFCQTWEGEIIRGGFNNGSGVSGTAFHFTIEDNPELVKKVQHYLEHPQEVKITYRMEFATWCRSDSGSVFLTDIQPMGDDVVNRSVTTEIKGPVETHELTPEEVEKREHDKTVDELLITQQRLIEKLIKEKK